MKLLFVRERAYDLGQYMIYSPKDWTQTSHTFDSKNLSIWTGNGLLYIDSYPETGMFNFFEMIYIKRCINLSKINKVMLSIGEKAK